MFFNLISNLDHIYYVIGILEEYDKYEPGDHSHDYLMSYENTNNLNIHEVHQALFDINKNKEK